MSERKYATGGFINDDGRTMPVMLRKGDCVVPRGGFPHTHTQFFSGCFRCDLSRDEEAPDAAH